MQCFTLIFRMIANKMLPQLPPQKTFDWTVKGKKIIDVIVKQNMGNTDGCAEQYQCSLEIYLMSVMLQCYSVLIDIFISEPGHAKDVVDGLNPIGKSYIYQ